MATIHTEKIQHFQYHYWDISIIDYRMGSLIAQFLNVNGSVFEELGGNGMLGIYM
jgi:hypothetical protein